VHKRVFAPIFAADAPEQSKAAAQALLKPVLDHLVRRLGDRATLVGPSFTVADAYLVTLLNWFRHVGIDLEGWPTLEAYHQRHLARPAVARAVAEEMAEYRRRGA
jgi:glutathione S-transferase